MILDSDKQIKQKIDAVLLQSELSGFARIKADVIARGVRTYYYLIQRREPEIPEYPSVVVACAQNEENLYIGKTRHDIRREQINGRLLERLEERLGPYGGSTESAPRCCIGHCAEPLAANKLLRREHVENIDDIYFGDAYRPRTGLIVAPCGNCVKTFNNVRK